MNDTALVIELRRYLSSQNSPSSTDTSQANNALSTAFTTASTSTTTSTVQNPLGSQNTIESLKQELNLAARVGQTLLMQLKSAERSKETQEREIRELQLQNAQLANENRRLAADYELLTESLEAQDKELNRLIFRLNETSMRAEKLNRAAAAARTLEREVQILEEMQSKMQLQLESHNASNSNSNSNSHSKSGSAVYAEITRDLGIQAKNSLHVLKLDAELGEAPSMITDTTLDDSTTMYTDTSLDSSMPELQNSPLENLSTLAKIQNLIIPDDFDIVIAETENNPEITSDNAGISKNLKQQLYLEPQESKASKASKAPKESEKPHKLEDAEVPEAIQEVGSNDSNDLTDSEDILAPKDSQLDAKVEIDAVLEIESKLISAPLSETVDSNSIAADTDIITTESTDDTSILPVSLDASTQEHLETVKNDQSLSQANDSSIPPEDTEEPSKSNSLNTPIKSNTPRPQYSLDTSSYKIPLSSKALKLPALMSTDFTNSATLSELTTVSKVTKLTESTEFKEYKQQQSSIVETFSKTSTPSKFKYNDNDVAAKYLRRSSKNSYDYGGGHAAATLTSTPQRPPLPRIHSHESVLSIISPPRLENDSYQYSTNPKSSDKLVADRLGTGNEAPAAVSDLVAHAQNNIKREPISRLSARERLSKVRNVQTEHKRPERHWVFTPFRSR